MSELHRGYKREPDNEQYIGVAARLDRYRCSQAEPSWESGSPLWSVPLFAPGGNQCFPFLSVPLVRDLEGAETSG